MFIHTYTVYATYACTVRCGIANEARLSLYLLPVYKFYARTRVVYKRAFGIYIYFIIFFL